MPVLALGELAEEVVPRKRYFLVLPRPLAHRVVAIIRAEMDFLRFFFGDITFKRMRTHPALQHHFFTPCGVHKGQMHFVPVCFVG